MKKRVLVIPVIILLLALSVFAIKYLSITGFSVGLDTGHQKTSSSVLNQLEKKGKTRVIIDIEENQEGIGLFSSSKLDKKSLPGKIKHDFGDKISLEVTQEQIEELENNPNIKSIGLVGKKQLFLGDSAPLVNATSSWNLAPYNNTNLTGKGQTVCVIDSGINYSHPDLGNCTEQEFLDGNCSKVIGGYDYCSNDINCSSDPDPNPMDVNGHGTHVSGIIAANGSIKGVAPDSKLVMIKVFNSTGTAWDDDIRKGIDWCVNNASKFNISVISMSLGGGLYQGYCDNHPNDTEDITGSINNAVSKNISVIVSTGNSGNHTHIASPACMRNATAVGMSYDNNYSGTFNWGVCNDSDPEKDQIACASNRNNITDLFAPGARINSTDLTGYTLKDGTSMSAPHVSGAFAIVNQFKKQELNKTKKPSSIENILNLTGKRINDNESGLNFSRIDMYSAIFTFDETSPNVTLISPENEYFGGSPNITLECNSTDEMQLKNLTIKLWNSSGDLVNSSVFNATNNSLNSKLNITNLSKGEYSWNCISYDEQDNKGTFSENYSFIYDSLSVNLISPADNTLTNQDQRTFNCSSQTPFLSNLTNMTLYIWDSNNIVYNKTKNLTGVSDYTLFNYTFETGADYLWNCLAKNNNSESAFASKNYTFIYDTSSPGINLNYPGDNALFDEGETIDFKFEVSEEVENCSLIIDNTTEDTDYSVETSSENSFSKSPSEGDYVWKIRCVDLAGNTGDSEEREVFVEAGLDDEVGISGGTTPTEEVTDNEVNEYNLSQDEIEKGVSKDLEEGDIVNFEIKNNSHEFELNNLGTLGANITIRSKSFNFILGIGETKKIDFDSDKTYDLLVKLNSINSNKADITLKQISEGIPTSRTFEESTQEENKTSDNQDKKSEKSLLKNPGFWGFVLVLIIILFLIINELVEYINEKRGKKPKGNLFSILTENSKLAFEWLKNKLRLSK